jgi:hypothetical protein
MVEQLKNLNADERAEVLTAPALVSLLAACTNETVSQVRKADAIELAHLKTFTADPLLIPFYREVENKFKEQFEACSTYYCPLDAAKRQMLKDRLRVIGEIVNKLEPEFAATLRRSLQGYAEHVRRSSHSILQDFIFPFPIPGLST